MQRTFQLGARSMIARADCRNVSSIAVMARLGMTLERSTEEEGERVLVYRIDA
jgi:RimJ/RimL family protein N-acetyltransferase